MRTYPEIPPSYTCPVTRAISFVVVRFSGDFEFNFAKCSAASLPINQVVVVDNTSNLFYPNLSLALAAGIKEAKHDIIALIHEDVLLPERWQSYFEESLKRLESHDATWGVIGSVGWTRQQELVGHWSDPHQYKNTFQHPHDSQLVNRLDEQILIVHRDRMPVLDASLPGIHHLGTDLSENLRQRNFQTYVVDAPTIHKFADDSGNLVEMSTQSAKISDRQSLTYKADRSSCNDYVKAKYPSVDIDDYVDEDIDFPLQSIEKIRQRDSPFIFLAKGGGASRVLTSLADDFDIFMGNEINASGDAMELVVPVYKSVIAKYQTKLRDADIKNVKRLRNHASKMISELPADRRWGFKLPESLFLIRELKRAFPKAKFVHMTRDPLWTCLRRTHMTARLDNHIGRLTVGLAYDYIGMPRTKILEDGPGERMAMTTAHQLALLGEQLAAIPNADIYSFQFENLLVEPTVVLADCESFFRRRRARFTLEKVLDKGRATTQSHTYSENSVKSIEKIVENCRREYGYL